MLRSQRDKYQTVILFIQIWDERVSRREIASPPNPVAYLRHIGGPGRARGKPIIGEGRRWRRVRQLSCFASWTGVVLILCLCGYASLNIASERPASRLSTHQFWAKILGDDDQRLPLVYDGGLPVAE